ncbi:MAG: c-type cytochrome [Verrucomicrobiota bacterium]
MGRLFLPLCSLLFSPLLEAQLHTTFSQDDKHFTTSTRLPALFVPNHQPASSLLEPGPFSVTWTGNLHLEKRQRLHFSFAGKGTATLTINDKEILSDSGTLGSSKSDRLRLNSGLHNIKLLYSSPESGPAEFRLLWEERSFPTEPIPASTFRTPGTQTNLASTGRHLFARHLCSKCHLNSKGFGTHAMPELNHIPPILAITGDRLNQQWLAHWIADPAQFRPDTNMPQLVPHNDAGKQQAADLAAYLLTLKTGTTPAPPSGDPTAGASLFHQLACVACHTTPDSTDLTSDRVPLFFLSQKFKPHALLDFLKNPSQLSPHTRMPNFRLTEKEAANLTAYLLAATKDHQPSQTFPQGDPQRGAELAKELHCGKCHAGLPLDPTSTPDFASISQKSWATTPCYPTLNLPKDAGPALESLRQDALPSLAQDTPTELLERHLTELRCQSCHQYDGKPATLAELHSETAHLLDQSLTEELLDQSFPHLSFTGSMLHTDYLSSILSGTANPRPRPWLLARMPSFTNWSPEIFATGFAHQHGIPPSSPQKPEPNDQLAPIGKQLIDNNEGLGCIACHAIGDQNATDAFEVAGINFNLTHQRLRPDFYHQWMHNPTRITPGTKMPRYSDDQGKSSLPVLDGEAKKQFEAIWHYLETKSS